MNKLVLKNLIDHVTTKFFIRNAYLELIIRLIIIAIKFVSDK